MTEWRLLFGFSEPVWKFSFVKNIYVIGDANIFKLQYLNLCMLGFMEMCMQISNLIV